MIRIPRGAALAALFACLAAAPAAAQEPDRTRPPELGPPPAFDAPAIQRFTLSNGLPVLLIEKHGVPLVQVDLLIEAGTVLDPPAGGGLASMTGAMLDEGAGDRTALEIADAVDFLGAELGTAVDEHATLIRLHTPLARFDEALPIMADVALRPTFPAEELERQRQERLTTLLQWHDEPRAIAAVAFADALYGDAHPYGAPAIGTEASLRALSVDDLRAFHGARFHAGAATLLVAGDVTAETLRPRLEAAFGSWPRGDAAAPAIPAPAQVAGRTIWLVDKPGAAQSEIRIGRVGVPRTSADYHAITVMNTILGGAFTSRLNSNLREDKGYSYGSYSFFDFRPEPGPFLAFGAVQTAVTAEALTEFFRELEGILGEVSEEELNRARNYTALGYPQAFQTVSGTSTQLAEIALYDLPDETFDRFIDRVMEVDLDDVRRVARETIDPANVVIVVVGDRAQIEAGIQALGLGEIRTLQVEEVLGPPPALADAR